MTRLRIRNDAEYGPVVVMANDPLWPWFLCGFISLALIALLFGGAMYFARLARNAPSVAPVIEDHK